jgi:hypothetical protein
MPPSQREKQPKCCELQPPRQTPAPAIFFVELAGIYVFATYWVIKSHEASKTNVDKKATLGKLRVKPHGLYDGFRALPVTLVDDQQAGQ